MNSSDDGGYVYDPAAFDTDADEGDEPPHPATVDREFDWRGWVLVGVLCVAFLVAPAAIHLVPPGADGYRFALLILPLAPALLLAITAVWATTRP
ncbi:MULTISPECIES: hypothetical protein [Natrinema]|uniref:Uncharacterized protein n=1 Tax=Natrinema gari JCM 14663 TaxID=1230459 RepID=L9Z0M3_9EURY|nr:MULTISPECIES: hypothetical protein [Natrinema]AFO57947.1 hypothetical protein NJ7G_2719 [Natrinema sp. J7-2]ELY79924.1 hypothetical protein C486_09430 [Natrinema gari JCM 14663]